jgi:hypothetical protein
MPKKPEGLSQTFIGEWIQTAKEREQQNQLDLCFPLPSKRWKGPLCASSRERMSSTGFFHSRLCGTLADAGCWSFILAVFVIHPPKKTQPQTEIDLVAAHDAVVVGTYDAGIPLHSLPGKALCSSLPLEQDGTDMNSCRTNAAPTPLSEQYEEPSIPYCVKLRAE